MAVSPTEHALLWDHVTVVHVAPACQTSHLCGPENIDGHLADRQTLAHVNKALAP